MDKLIRTLKSNLTMKRGQCLFVDSVDGSEVFEYYDCYGQRWLANYCHWFSRVEG